MNDEITNELSNEEDTPLTTEQQKKAINLQDLIYVKAYIKKYVNEAVQKLVDGVTPVKLVTKAETAVKDGNGNDIASTYLPKTATAKAAEKTDFTNSQWTVGTADGLEGGYFTSGATYEIRLPYDANRKFNGMYGTTGAYIHGGAIGLVEYNSSEDMQVLLNTEFFETMSVNPETGELSHYAVGLYVTRGCVEKGLFRVFIEKVDLMNPEGVAKLIADGENAKEFEYIRHPYDKMYCSFELRRIR